MNLGRKFLYEITWEWVGVVYTDYISAKNVEKALKIFYKRRGHLLYSIQGITEHRA